ncbi:uncharacterized protein LOC120451927 isoform X1 [Drosophila santomea]|uniref:uncharacterized protein LOC120451927 isoform X1 n=2 Tax=Drosophila santomea TaxID=129105 RepID=UPI001953F3EF|nr:uncharacterized protein LOC120451927 isoform X1 [Drosophila santomea]XP_039491876.1 uncharacterized protein LOC120451927 isoform X1 [Drosophila santomea]XP_039491877.1 uncharacterized protein LOC120451927 isoform X1 [Drosophila santomea]XP_039491878.1 uncharacterized protein LOC120451927 isoform X1 [Drosophila santomea]
MRRHLACGGRNCRPRKDTDTDTDTVTDVDVGTDASVSAAPRPIDLAKSERTEDNESCSPPKATNPGPHATIAATATSTAAETPAAAATAAEAATGGKRKTDRAEASSGDLWPCLLYGSAEARCLFVTACCAIFLNGFLLFPGCNLFRPS